ncbi:bifunctional alpha,alpha-trehalose-phosphate synthase (UDP-forming)/trehalose-phosphatase [bacterium]|nr:bifunctional alpha,alpha-trehalose-phosphate synthase (UDP-forming)/trehalose-phosphatase [bacterium]
MSRLLIISNRLPVSVIRKDGEFCFKPSVGGVATGLNSLGESFQKVWLGWPGDQIKSNLPLPEKEKVCRNLRKLNCRAIFLNQEDIDSYYYGFCNQTIWSNFHYFMEYTVYDEQYWESYKRVNHLFYEEVARVYQPGDLIWVHDYQLMLLPKIIRDNIPSATIGFFLHIPFPPYEVFSALPWRSEILKGILGSDLVGFHTYQYAENFLNSVRRIEGHEHSLKQLIVDNRIVIVEVLPMSINFRKFNQSSDEKEVQKEYRKMRRGFGDKKVIISIDRLDYTKGIPQRVEAFGEFLEQNPQYREKIVMILVAVPSRTEIPQYELLKKELEETLSRINGKFSTIGWVPILYFYRSFDFESLSALYLIADIALITPLRDGMNLIAKEYLASRSDGRGVLILSEKAGSARELGEAIVVNPYNKKEIARALKESLEMPLEEQIERNATMRNRLQRYDITRWANDFIEAMVKARKYQEELSAKRIDDSIKARLLNDYRKARRRLIALDYDGTLRGFVKDPDQAGPQPETLEILEKLVADNKNDVVIISGRKRSTLEKWFSHLNINLIGEHGIWIRQKGGEWQMIEPMGSEWKEDLRPILELYVDRTPGSFIEEKDFSLVWHYRKAETELGELRARELKDALLNRTANLNLGILSGSKVVEIKSMGVTKGRAILHWLKRRKWDIIITAGDDWTDEDTFEVMPPDAYSIKVGFGYSKANFQLDSVSEMKKLLKKLVKGK